MEAFGASNWVKGYAYNMLNVYSDVSEQQHQAVKSKRERERERIGMIKNKKYKSVYMCT